MTKSRRSELLSKKQDHRSERIVSRNGRFKPSTTIIPKIMHVLLNADYIDRTLLARKARINYADMMRHLEWLEKKKIISITLENGKITIKLNNRWREFAEMQMDLYGL